MTNHAVYFGAVRSRSGFWQPRSPFVWTCVGGLAIPLWATWPALSVVTRAIPPFECLTLIFAISWLVMLSLERQPPQVGSSSSGWQGWIPPIAFALGESGAAIFFLLATHHIGTAEANLISYLWPGLTVGMGAMLGLFHLKLRHAAGIALGFVGVA